MSRDVTLRGHHTHGNAMHYLSIKITFKKNTNSLERQYILYTSVFKKELLWDDHNIS